MPFLLPRRLIEYEYFETSEQDEEYAELAKPYSKDMDFAFFAVHFGYSISEYEALTPRQKAFILKERERKTVEDTNLMKLAVLTAVSTARSGRNVEIWEKGRSGPSQKQPITKEEFYEIKTMLEGGGTRVV